MTRTEPKTAPDVASVQRVFVGRERELGELLGALERAERGHGSSCFVIGEPGIGKTRLADELSDLAQRRGTRVLWGRCWVAEGRPPYWPWLQAIRAYLRSADLRRVVADLGETAAALTHVLPELRAAGAPVPPALEPEAARFRLFEAVGAWLRLAAREQALLLVLDDLHWADVPSLRLLELVAGSLADTRALVVGIYREAEARQGGGVGEALAALCRSGPHLRLTGFNAAEVGAFIARVFGRNTPETVVDRIHSATDGNPFFVDEIVRLLDPEEGDGGWSLPTAGGLPISQGVRGAIRQRLAPLPDWCREGLAAAAALGREFDVGLMGEMCSLTADAVLDRLAPALAHDVVARVVETPGRYRFAHALVRETIYEALPAGERVRLHRRVAALLESRHRAGVDVVLPELSHHFFEAAAGGDVGKAAQYARLAGDQAVELLAHEAAVEQYARALQMLELAPAPEHVTQTELLLALGAAQGRAGHAADARWSLRRASALARQLGDAPLLARAAIALSNLDSGLVWAEYGRADEELMRLLEEALAALGNADGALRARVMTRLATELIWTSARDRAAALSSAALEVARETNDPATLAYALLGRVHCVPAPEDVDMRRELLGEILSLAERSGERELTVNARLWCIADNLHRGDFAAAQLDTQALVRLVEALRRPGELWMIDAMESQRALLEGRFAAAETHATQITERAARDSNALQVASALLFLVRREQGRLAELEGGLRTLVNQYPRVAVWRAGLALLYSELGRHVEARVELAALLNDGLAQIPRDMTWSFTMSCIAEVCATCGEDADVVPVFEALRPFADRHVLAGPFSYLGPIAYYLARLAIRRRDWSAAESLLLDAERSAASAGARPLVARVLAARASMHAARALGADQACAETIANQAREVARELGMKALTAALDQLPHGRATGQAVLRREGQFWTVMYDGRVLRLREAKGFHYLVRLLREPGRDFHVLDLVHAHASASPSGRVGSIASLDSRAKADYRSRLDALRAELSEATAFNDEQRATKLREEIDFLTAELARAVGLGGADREAGTDAERARAAVTKAIRVAIRAVGAADPPLGEVLDKTIMTGTFCRYAPLAELRMAWDV